MANAKKVLIGFMTTAYLTLLLVLLYYLIGYFEAPHLNVLDQGVLAFLWRKIRLRPARSWEPTIRKGVLMFSDQQLVTGIAILAGGYSQLQNGLSSYHWQILVYLAWFSSLTHLATLTVLRQYFREHPTIRTWRVCLMLFMLLPLSVALLPTGNGDWFTASYDYYGARPAICGFRNLAPSEFKADIYSTPTMVLSLLVLASSYITRVVKLLPDTAAFARRWLRTKPSNVLKKLLDRMGNRAKIQGASELWTCGYSVLLSIYLVLRAIFDLNESMLWEVRLTQV